MLVTLFILVILVMQRVVKTEAVHVAIRACGHDLGVVGRDCDVLHIVGQGEQVQGFVVDGVVDEDVLFLVDREEVAAVAVFYYLAVGDLDLFQDLEAVVYYGEDFEHGRETYGQEEATGVHGDG